MASEWNIVRIGDCAASISETHPRNKEKLIFLNTSDILEGKILHSDYSSVDTWPGQAKKSIRQGDILFSEIRPANGRYAYVDRQADDFVVSTKLMVIRADERRVLPKFLYHFLTQGQITRWLQHLAESRSGTFPQITFAQVAELETELPPIKVQQGISDFADALQERIELNRRMNETLEAMARALFQSWFVDFDPVRAKAEGRDTGLPAQIATLFPDSFEDSELGVIPSGWRAGSMANFSSLNPKNLSKSTRPDSIQYVDLSNTKWGRIEVITPYEAASAPSRAQRILRVGDTIIGTVRPGNGSFALINREGLTGSTGFAVLRPLSTEYVEFVYLAATMRVNIDALAHLADGGAYPAVRPEAVVSAQVVVPSREVLCEFSRQTKPLLLKIDANEQENILLAQLRDTLLPKLISGELRGRTLVPKKSVPAEVCNG